VTDLVVLYVPIGIFLGRLANFVNDELWGRVTDVAWAVRFPNGGYLPRHPSQLYEALAEGVLMFVVLNVLWRFKWVRERVGFVSGMFAVLYTVFRMSMEQFREPDAQLGFFFNTITMGQILSVPFLIIGLYVIIRSVKLLK
jgi:phosphatidylglycerol:prolipoprotein diacylglycerol transferase